MSPGNKHKSLCSRIFSPATTDQWTSLFFTEFLNHKSREISAARTLKLPWNEWRGRQSLHCMGANWFQYTHVSLATITQLTLCQQSSWVSVAAFFAYGTTFTTESLVVKKQAKKKGRGGVGDHDNRLDLDRDLNCLTCSIIHRQTTLAPGSIGSLCLCATCALPQTQQLGHWPWVLKSIFFLGPLAPVLHVQGCQSWQISSEKWSEICWCTFCTLLHWLRDSF